MEVSIFHVLNRGVDKRDIFLDDQDRLRFIHDLFEFNDTEPVSNLTHFLRTKGAKSKEIATPYIARMGKNRKMRKLLVNIHAFCLMSNHYHLMVSALVEGGIAQFMKKLNVGFAMYFNEKYERSGALFQGRYKRVVVTRDAHFVHLPYYIHLNPLDSIVPEWRQRVVGDHNEVLNFLRNYRWSSHLDYAGVHNFPSVTQREFLMGFFGGTEGYKRNVASWLKSISIDGLRGVLLE